MEAVYCSFKINYFYRIREEIHSQMRSQQVAIESVRDKISREKREEMENREQEFHQDMGERIIWKGITGAGWVVRGGSGWS